MLVLLYVHDGDDVARPGIDLQSIATGGTMVTMERVVGSNMALITDPELERKRARLFLPLIMEHSRGYWPRQVAFDYALYATADDERCFDAAVALAKKHDLIYMEGIVVCSIYGPRGEPIFAPLAHAWCADEKGQLVDPTMHKNQHNKSLKYLGLPIKLAYADAWHAKVGYYGCMDGDKDGRKIGIHFDPPEEWLDTRLWGRHENVRGV